MAKNGVRLGFIITSHADPDQLLRLVVTLNRLYYDPVIVCHHDFSQCALQRDLFPPNVRFVTPSVHTSWGTWSIVRAFLQALELLYRDGGPDWFVNLSAADYPVVTAETVLAALADARCDAFIDVHPQDLDAGSAATLVGSYNPALIHLQAPATFTLKARFYDKQQFWLPRFNRTKRWYLGRLTLRLPFRTRFFGRAFPLFWGDAWFYGNRRVAKVLLAPTARHLRLQRYLRWRTFPEESYFQTVLANTAGLTLDRNNLRFTSWQGGAHPVLIGERELASALSSGDHFARKFAARSAELDLVDAHLAASDRTQAAAADARGGLAADGSNRPAAGRDRSARPPADAGRHERANAGR